MGISGVTVAAAAAALVAVDPPLAVMLTQEALALAALMRVVEDASAVVEGAELGWWIFCFARMRAKREWRMRIGACILVEVLLLTRSTSVNIRF